MWNWLLPGLQSSWSSWIWSDIKQNLKFQRCMLEISKASHHTWHSSRFDVSYYFLFMLFHLNNWFVHTYFSTVTDPLFIICFVDSALVARALIENTNLIKWSLLLKAFSGLFALICGNGYIVGINQIYDIGIDKYAPLLITDFFYSYYILLVEIIWNLYVDHEL